MISRLLIKPLLARLSRSARKDEPGPTGVPFDGNVLRVLSDPRLYSTLRWKHFLKHAFVPRVFYDIGANDPYSVTGQQQVFKPLMPETQFFLFEAMQKHEPALKQTGEPYVLVVLGSEDGVEKTFYESKLYTPGTGDSYYRDQTETYAPDAVIETRHRTRRLDSVVRERGWPLPDFIKLDTQGSELDILKGAPDCLANARGLQIECNLQIYNEGAPLLSEVLAFAESAGFRIYDVVQLGFAPWNQLLQIDALFMRDAR